MQIAETDIGRIVAYARNPRSNEGAVATERAGAQLSNGGKATGRGRDEHHG